MIKRSKKISKILLCLLLTSTFIVPSISPAFADTGLNVQKHSKEEVRDYINKNVNLDQKVTYATKPSTSKPYAIGKLSNTTLNSALNTLNAMRYIAGISNDVKLKDDYIDYAQGATLVNAVNDKLTHYPAKPSGMSTDLFDLCNTGAGSSNLAWNYTNLNYSIAYGWMRDDDSSNIDRVGHRRWVLNPTMKYTGFGATKAYTAMYAFDEYYGKSGLTVAWPGQTMPTDYFNPYDPWSLSMDDEVDASKVNVTLTNKKTNKTWQFNSKSADGYFNVNNAGYGQYGCIIFRPDNIESYNDGDIYNVKITGLPETINYDVNFFDLKPITSITLDKTKVDLTMDTNSYWNYYYLDGKINPADASNNLVKWSSSNTKVAKIEYSHGYAGSDGSIGAQIEIVGYGSTTITVKAGNGVKATCVINVNKPGNKVDKVSNLKVRGKTYNSLSLSWDKVSNADGYRVYRSTSKNGTYKGIATIYDNSTTTYKNTGLTTGKTYYYKVKAYKYVNGERVYSSYSNMTSGKTRLSTPSIKLSSATKKVYVKWSKIYGASGYEIYRKTGKSGTYKKVKTISSGSTTSFTNTKLSSNKTYYYKIRAYKNVNGKKVYSYYSSDKYIKVK